MFKMVQEAQFEPFEHFKPFKLFEPLNFKLFIMILKLKRIASPFVFELSNENGNFCLIDASPAIGGTDKGLRPMELLAGSLASCASIDVINILRKKRIQLGAYEVHINAGRAENVPAAFQHIHLKFVFYNNVNEQKLATIIELAINKYCSVAASLKDEIKISYSIELKSSEKTAL